MKRIIITLITLSLIVFCPVTTSNAAVIRQHSIEYLTDGSYYETTITTNDFHSYSLIRTASLTRSANKTTTYTSSSGAKLWSVTVTGNFSYVKGKSSKCTSSSVSATAYSASWKITNKSSSKSGNTAIATATGTEYLQGKPIISRTKKVSLTCDVNGNLS